MSESSAPIGQPDAAEVAGSRIARFAGYLTWRHGTEFSSYLPLWRWSVDPLNEFRFAVWDFFQIESDGPGRQALADTAMPGAQWFPGTRVNYVPGRRRRVGMARVLQSPTGPRSERPA